MSHLKTNSLIRRVWRRLREQGPLGMVHVMIYRIRESMYEWSLGIESAEPVVGLSTGDDSELEDYFPTDYQLFLRAIRRLTINSASDVFLDIGCGKGRLLVMAAQQPFRRVIGVEYSEKLCANARRQLSRLQPHERNRVEVIQADAAVFRVPDEVTVIFMFNPFTGRVLEQSLERIRESLMRSPRVVSLYYLQPAYHKNTLETFQWLICRAVLPTAPRFDMRLYEYVGWPLPSEPVQTRVASADHG